MRLSRFALRRARWGVRRTFQTEQAIEQLSVYDNVAMIHEHSKLAGASRATDVLGAIGFVGLEADPNARVGSLGARDRRLVEVARAIVGRPRLVLLDEPAAGPARRGDGAPRERDPAHPGGDRRARRSSSTTT